MLRDRPGQLYECIGLLTDHKLLVSYRGNLPTYGKDNTRISIRVKDRNKSSVLIKEEHHKDYPLIEI